MELDNSIQQMITKDLATNCQIKCNFLPKKTSDGVFQTKTLRVDYLNP